MTQRVVHLTLDFVLDAECVPWLLEINSVPVGAGEAYEAEAFYGELAQSARRHIACKPGRAIVVLPESVARALGDRDHYRGLQVLAKDNRYAGFIKSASTDILCLCNNLVRAGTPVTTITSLDATPPDFDKPDTMVFWFSKRRIPLRYAFSVNDEQTLTLSEDKLLFSRKIATCGLQIPVVPTYQYSSERPSTQQAAFYIVKPRRGTGSRGIRRLPRDSLDEVWNEPDISRDDVIIQPWIEPMIVKRNGFKYYADFRAQTFTGGLPIFWVRVCSFPIDGRWQDDELSWLPTTGHMYELKSELGLQYLDIQLEAVSNALSRSTELICNYLSNLS